MTGDALTIEEFKLAMPPGMDKSVNPLLVMQVNNILSSEEELSMFKENLLSYTSVLQHGKFKMSSYINAVKYVGFKNMQLTNREAYRRTFPEKVIKWESEGRASKDIASYVHAYNSSKLVNLIFAQTMIPVHILNQPAFQRALNVQLMIMDNEDASYKVRSDAANSVMTQLKPPEEKRVELDIAVRDTTQLQELKQITLDLATKQHAAIASSTYTAKEIANQDIIEMEKE